MKGALVFCAWIISLGPANHSTALSFILFVACLSFL